jgi:hypothetical protein
MCDQYNNCRPSHSVEYTQNTLPLHKKALLYGQGFELLAGATRIELATSGVTGRRSNQLNYAPYSLNPKFEYQNPKQIKK